MASLEERGDAFHIVFRFAGRKYSRSLKTPDREAAETRLGNLEQTIRDVKSGRFVIPEGADVATFLLSDGKLTEPPKSEKPMQAPTLDELITQFFDSLPAGTLEESTLKGMKVHQGHLLRILGKNSKLEKISLGRLDKYVSERMKEQSANGKIPGAATLKKELVTLRRIWSWGKKRELVPHELPALKDIALPKTNQRPPFQTWEEITRQIELEHLEPEAEKELWNSLYLRTDQIHHLLEHVREKGLHPFLYPMFVTAAHSGARRSELIRSRITDIQADYLVIRERKRVRNQASTRRVPLSTDLKDVLSNWLKDHPGGPHTFCLESTAKGRQRSHPEPLSVHQANDHFKRTLAGSQWEKIRGWHCLRHSFISNLASQGVDQRLIDEFVGHTSEEVRRRYRHLLPDVKEAAIRSVFG